MEETSDLNHALRELEIAKEIEEELESALAAAEKTSEDFQMRNESLSSTVKELRSELTMVNRANDNIQSQLQKALA